MQIFTGISVESGRGEEAGGFGGPAAGVRAPAPRRGLGV